MNNYKYEELESILGYHFGNRSLLELALTHSSTPNKKNSMRSNSNNERLEFIGDAFLDAIIGSELYNNLNNATEGDMTKIRANIVCERSLAKISRTLGIGKYLILGKGEQESGGSDKDSILADAFEAIIGAIFEDSSFEKCRDFVLRICEENIKLAIAGKLFRDYKTELQELLQQKYRSIKITYNLINEEGPEHCKIFTIECIAHDDVLGVGSGRSKKEAEQNAAKDVILKGDY